jgi:Ca-activated chloride channel family protein
MLSTHHGNRTIRPAALAAAVCLGALLLPTRPVSAQSSETGDRTLSPYFFVDSRDPQVDPLPLKETSAKVRIVGVIADVTVTQVYRNEGLHPLEAVYVFPGSTRAAVYRMIMTIGSRTVTAVIKERRQARAAYEEARAQGRTASLLEQQRPNAFQMNVANIMPGDEVKMLLAYTELLVPTDGLYEFVYPTVVGPRYSNQPAVGAPESETWVENPYRHQGEPSDSTFSIGVTLTAGVPIQKITCPSHRTSIRYDGPADATVTLDPADERGGNRDFILRFGLAGVHVKSGLLLYHGKDGERFFLLMVEPPKRVPTSQVPPREYLFVVDVSGSMHGFPLEVSKKLLADLISHLRPTDAFNVLLFSGGSRVMSEKSVAANPESVAAALRFIDREQGGGGTELLPALRRALALPRSEGVSRTIVIATDGYVRVEKEAFDLIRSSLDRSNVFAFGIGSAVNRFLIEGIARAGMGEPFVVANPEEAAAQAERFRSYVTSPVLTHVNVEFSGFDAYDVEPQAVPDVLAERPVIVFGKWRGPASGRIVVRGLTADAPYAEAFDVGRARPDRRNAALRYLWARHRIAALGDDVKLRHDDDTVEEITRLGLAYGLLTDYTSFVAVDRTVRNTDGRVETVTQPLPLPQGVSDLAVGGPAKKVIAAFTSSAFAYGSAPQGVTGGAAGGVPGSAVREEVSVTGAYSTLHQSAPLPRNACSPTSQGREAAQRTGAPRTAWDELKAAARNWRFPAASAPSTVTLRLAFAGGKPLIAGLQVEGALSRSAVERAIRPHLPETNACFEKAVAPGARIVVILSIRPDGAVDRVEVAGEPV